MENEMKNEKSNEKCALPNEQCALKEMILPGFANKI